MFVATSTDKPVPSRYQQVESAIDVYGQLGSQCDQISGSPYPHHFGFSRPLDLVHSTHELDFLGSEARKALSRPYAGRMPGADVSSNQKVTIDVCKLHGPDTVFLQQAAHLTGGSYLYLEHKEALLQFLIVSAVSRILINTIRSNLHAPDDFPSSASPSTLSCDSNTGQGRLSRRVFLSQEHHRCGLRLQRLPQQCVIF